MIIRKNILIQNSKLFQCFLSSSDGSHSTRDLCELACQEPGRNSTCRSTGQWVASGQRADRGLTEKLSLRPGAPCDNFQGYCDVFLKCRQVEREGETHLYNFTLFLIQVDAEGPLVRLKNLLFNQRTLLTIAQWVTVGSYYYPDGVNFNPVLPDLLVRRLTYGHWVRHHDGSLHQVFRSTHSL